MSLSFFLCTHLNGFKYSYVSVTIQLNISHLLAHSWMIKHFYLKQFNLVGYLLAFSWHVKQFSLYIKPYQVPPLLLKVDLKAIVIKVYLYSLKDTATRVQILDETDCISHSTNTLGKGMNPINLPSAMGK